MEYQYWLACNAEYIGNRVVCCLIRAGLTAKEIYHSSTARLMKIKGISPKEINKIERIRRDWNLKEAFGEFEKKGIRLVTMEQQEYPKKLSEIWDQPYGLFVKGALPEERGRSVAIVGARMCSEYGRETARKLAEVLAHHGIQIISGMALGIDSAGHAGALDGGGATFAVLGCGPDVCYPLSNRTLYERITASGGVLTEYPPGTAPLPRRFPMRNRIISGLSDLVIVVEAKEKSGSLITADAALEQGKEVYAVPGRITDVPSGGCNRLIKQGAGIVISVGDFLKELEISMPKETVSTNFSQNLLEKEESLVYALLDLQAKNINEIINESNLDVLKVMEVLAGLQKKGLARETFKNYYIRTLNTYVP